MSPQLVVHRGPGANADIEDLVAARGLTVAAYVDHGDDEQRGWLERFRGIPNVIVALEPAVRRKIAERVARADMTFATLVRSGGPIAPSVTFAEGALVVGLGPLSVSSATAFGRHLILMTPASVGHDCAIGDFVTIFPSAVISGHVAIEDDVVLDVGAVIANGRAGHPLVIGRGARIGVGAVVMTSVAAGAFVTGNPGRAQPR